ncbi:MAG: response regulator [Erysipelotrichaceae bacterium]|nr:response regulator [Erysipelotrichaceae bacterium]
MENREIINIDMNILFENGKLSPAIEWISEQIPGGFFIYKADGNMELLYANKAMIRIFGCSNLEEFKELTGYTFPGLVHPEDFRKIQDSIDEQIAKDENDNFDYVEYRIIRKDGKIRWVDDYGHFANLPGYGNVYYVFIGDITQQHNAREEIRRRGNVYSSMLEQFNAFAKDSLAVMRNNLTSDVIEDVKGSDLFDTDYPGGSVAASIQARIDSFPNDLDKKRYEEAFRREKLIERFYNAEGPVTFIGYSIRQSGRSCFVKYQRNITIDPLNGDIIAFGTESECDNEKVSEILNDKVLVKQYDMVTYIASDQYNVVIGDAKRIKRGSIFPKKPNGNYADYINNQVIPAASRSAHNIRELTESLSLEKIGKELEENESYTVDVTCEIDGEIFNKRFTYYLLDPDAKYYILLKSDVTDVLREQRKQNELLSEALQEAEHANAAKTSFLSNMSHEIRTPMNAIIGLDSIALKDPNLSSQTRDYLEKIGESARHLLSLINDILDMTRIESGRMALRKEEFSFGTMLEQINTMIQAQCRDKGLNYECRVIGKVDDWYFGDDMKLKQILINILSNAIKFTNAPGSILFTVEKVAEFDRQSTLRFVISDTGIGMDKDFLPKLFNPFTQEDSSRSSKYGSTGLGMAITKNIVEVMNGTISVESEKGVGSTFTVNITLKNANKTGDEQQDFDVKNISALVVDDDVIALEHAKTILEEVGISADTCKSGAEALSTIEIHHAKKTPYNLVLIDWKMPDQDGVEVTRQIRNNYSDETTIIILTAYNWDDVMEEAINAGVDSFMAKPLFAANVLDEFERVMKRKNIIIGQKKQETELNGKHILLAEDVEINAEIIKLLLETKKISVDVAENGEIALNKFRSSQENYYDAILMDVRMPVMDGLEAAQKIRTLGRNDSKSIPIIALTANVFDEDVQRSLQAGMNAHLSKPVEPEMLYKTISELISENKK